MCLLSVVHISLIFSLAPALLAVPLVSISIPVVCPCSLNSHSATITYKGPFDNTCPGETETSKWFVRWNATTFENLERRFESLERKFDDLERMFDSLERRFDSIERRFDSLERSFEQAFDSLKRKFDKLEATLAAKIDKVQYSVDVFSVIAIESNGGENTNILQRCPSMNVAKHKVARHRNA